MYPPKALHHQQQAEVGRHAGRCQSHGKRCEPDAGCRASATRDFICKRTTSHASRDSKSENNSKGRGTDAMMKGRGTGKHANPLQLWGFAQHGPNEAKHTQRQLPMCNCPLRSPEAQVPPAIVSKSTCHRFRASLPGYLLPRTRSASSTLTRNC